MSLREATICVGGGQKTERAVRALWNGPVREIEDYSSVRADSEEWAVLADNFKVSSDEAAIRHLDGDPLCAGVCWNGEDAITESDWMSPGYMIFRSRALPAGGLGSFGELLYSIRRSGWRFAQGGIRGQVLGAPSGAALIDPESVRSRFSDDFELGYCDRPLGIDLERPLRFVSSRRPELRREIVANRKKRVKISLCMIARDESPHIYECVKSVAPFVDELLVGDTGSLDDTKVLAAKAGATVIDVPWNDHFAEARNAVLERAKNPWIFWLDADDVLPWNTGEAMLKWAESAAPETVGASMVVRFVKAGVGENQYVHHVKLFRNLPGIRFKGRIHESPLDAIVAQGGIERLRYDASDGLGQRDAEIWHKHYDTSEEGQKKKNERNRRLLWKAISEDPLDGFSWYNMGMQHGWQNDHQGAEAFYKKALEIGVCEGIDAKAAVGIGVAAFHAGRLEEAVNWANKAISINPFWPEPYMLRGEAENLLGQIPEAVQSLSLAFAFPQGSGWFGGREGVVGAQTALKLVDALEALGRFGEAAYWARRAVDMSREAATLQRLLRIESRLVKSENRLRSALVDLEAY